VISSDGRTIFVGDRNGYVYAFRPDDLSVSDTSIKPTAGALKLKGPIIGGLVLDASSGNLFVTSGERLFAIRTADLERRIENRDANVGVIELFKAGGDIWSAPIVQGGRIFFASLDGNLYAINATSGEEAWRFKGTRALVSSPVVTDGGLVLVGGFDDRLHAIDMASGRQRWDFVAANWIWTSPVVDGGRAYVGDFDGTVHALNLSDGSPIWSKPIAKRPIVASPVLAQGVLVIAAQNGELYGLDPGTQTQRWGPSDVGTSLNADLVADGELVYLAPNGCVTPVNESNRVYYISVNARTGDLTKTTEVC
jgi:outer membrane protein assembly factor BamB